MDEPTPPTPKSRVDAWAQRRAVRRTADAAAFAMLAAAAVGLALFGGRREIARQFAEDWLRERGIASGFTVEAVDAGAFVGSVRLGPADDPVFAADRVEVAYDLTAPWAGAPFSLTTTAVRLVRPRLKVSFDGERLSAGPLDALIEEFLARPDTGAPGPAVLVEDANATVVTPLGQVRLLGDAAIDDGDLLRFDGALLPTTLQGEDFRATFEGGTLRLRKVAQTLTANLRLSVDYAGGGLDLDGGQAAIDGVVPYPDLDEGTLAGAVALGLDLTADRLAFGDTVAGGLDTDLSLTGTASGELASPAFSGGLAGAANAGLLTAGGVEAGDLRTNLDLRSFSLRRDGQGVSVRGAGSADARSGRIGGGALNSASAAGSISFQAGEDGLALIADADVRGDGGLPAARARRIARATPVVSGDPAQAAAIAASLRDFQVRAPRLRLAVDGDGAVLALGAPATVTSRSGGRAVVSPRGGPLLAGGGGAFDLAIDGGGLPDVDAQVAAYTVRAGAVDARLAVRAALDAPPAQDAVIDVEGRLRAGGGRTTFALARCGAVSAGRVDFGDIDAQDVDARVCPTGQPLVSAGGGAWRLAGRFEDLDTVVPAMTLAGADASGTFTASGRGDMNAAEVQLAGARIADTEAVTRFNPVGASGRLTLAGGVWRGAFPLAAGSGRRFAEVALVHDVAAERGRAEIDASALTFDEGLQPVDLSPLGEAIRNADGTAAFTGRFLWGPEGASSSGELAVPRLTFASPAGTVTNLSTAVVFTSLSPLVSPPGQIIAAERVNAIVGLEDVRGAFALAGETLRIEALTAVASRGRLSLEPTTIPLAAGGTVQSVLTLDDVDLGELVATSTLAGKVDLDAVIDGRLPFQFGPAGLRFEGGRIVATGPGRISIDRTALTQVETDAAAPPSPMDAAPQVQEVNAIQDFAYQAMENLSFDSLEAGVDSVPGGRLSVLFRIEGEHDPEKPEQARVGLAELLSGQAFRRRIPLPARTPVNLTLDTSLNFDELLAAWGRQWAQASD